MPTMPLPRGLIAIMCSREPNTTRPMSVIECFETDGGVN
jgi:hypothetical protein